MSKITLSKKLSKICQISRNKAEIYIKENKVLLNGKLESRPFITVMDKDKIELKKIQITYSDLPLWFQRRTDYLKINEKKQFLNYFNKEPDMHIVFKDEDKLNQFEENLIKTSNISGFLLDKKNIKNIKSFTNGDWWVQDFSSFLPMYSFEIKDKNKIYLDACAAPGGKSFQILSNKLNSITL